MPKRRRSWPYARLVMTRTRENAILGEDNPNSETLDLGVLGEIARPPDPAGYGERGTYFITDCKSAVALGEPDCIPSDWHMLDQKYSLRELIEGAARIARLGQDAWVHLADDGQPLDRQSFSYDSSITEMLSYWVAQWDTSESGDRISALRAAALLAYVFRTDPMVGEKRDVWWEFLAGLKATRPPPPGPHAAPER